MQPGVYTRSPEPVTMQPADLLQASGQPSRSPGLMVDRFLRVLFGAVVLAASLWLLWVFARLVIYLIVGIILAYLMRPAVDRLQGIGLRRIPAIVSTFIVVFGGLGVLAVFIVPFIIRQVGDLSQQFTPEMIAEAAGSLEDGIRRFVPLPDGAVLQWGERTFDELIQEERITATVGSMVGFFTDVFYAVVIIPFVTFFILKDGIRLRHSVLQLVPNRYFEIALNILEKVETSIGRYFGALLVQCTSVGMLSAILLTVAGLENALAIGVFAGLANTIPYFGPIVGLLAGALAGLSQTGDFVLLPGVLVAMGLTRVVDDIFFQPFFFSRAAQAHPLVILFVVLIGAQLAGIIGMLVAIPVATTVRVVAQQVTWSLRNYRILKAA